MVEEQTRPVLTSPRDAMRRIVAAVRKQWPEVYEHGSNYVGFVPEQHYYSMVVFENEDVYTQWSWIVDAEFAKDDWSEALLAYPGMLSFIVTDETAACYHRPDDYHLAASILACL